ncbi:MAG: DUF3256 family protein [Muribaculaceae bacterium]|nr:DUF3256 family protein [Muribaculaceae bacterium]
MPKLKLPLTLLAAAAVLGGAARTAADFFITAPSSVMPFTSSNLRMDMLDYYRYGSDRTMPDRSATPLRITAESERTMTVAVGEEGARVQLAVLPAGKDTLVAVGTTVTLPAPDSRVDIYNKDWTPARVKTPAWPAYSDWVTAADYETEARLPFVPAEAAFDTTAKVLPFTCRADSFLAPDEYEMLRGSLVPAIVYDVKGKTFKRRKP